MINPCCTSLCAYCHGLPGDASSLGGSALLINLILQGSFYFGNLVSAKCFLDPGHHFGLGQIGKRDQVLGALETDAAVCASRVGIVFGVDGVVGGEYKTIGGFAFKVGDSPGGDGYWSSGLGHGSKCFVGV